MDREIPALEHIMRVGLHGLGPQVVGPQVVGLVVRKAPVGLRS